MIEGGQDVPVNAPDAGLGLARRIDDWLCRLRDSVLGKQGLQQLWSGPRLLVLLDGELRHRLLQYRELRDRVLRNEMQAETLLILHRLRQVFDVFGRDLQCLHESLAGDS